MPMYVVIPEATEYVDRNLATASWYDRYLIDKGMYEILPVTLDHRPTTIEGAYWWKVTFDATLIYSYRVNRVFTASSASHEYPNRRGFVHQQRYAYTPLLLSQSFNGLGLIAGDVPGACVHNLSPMGCFSEDFHYKHEAEDFWRSMAI
jgi:hypothetical protein